jgi:hypothetical protein
MKQLSPLLACALLTACGGGTDSESTSAIITASEGGTLALEGSETSLTFPAGAVATDIEVSLDMGTLSDYAEHEGALTNIVVLGPSMNLESPASLRIDLDGQIEPDARLHIVQYTDGVWIRPEVGAIEVGSGGVGVTSIFRLAPTAIVVESVQASTGRIEGQALHIYTEEPLPGIEFKLIVNDSVAGTATSGDDGSFAFENVPTGTVVVDAQVDAGQNCYNDPTSKDVDVTEAEAVRVFFGFVPGPC